ncbi:MAG: deoxyribodipyrimidine photo-lyase [Alphaproteobacteria bacterium]|nr:deoxyribodipyrimidine photo-lyase [Alphaproteobacteria bacterium]
MVFNLSSRGQTHRNSKKLISEIDGCAVYWNRCCEPHAIKRDKEIKSQLKNTGISCESFKASLLAEPWELQTKTDKPYQVFTTFWTAFQRLTFPKLLPIPDIYGYQPSIFSDEIETWGPYSSIKFNGNKCDL